MKKYAKTRSIFGKILGALMTLVVVVLLGVSISSANAYNCKPGDTECEEAKANMQQKRNEANAFTRQANSISEIIQQLNAEISSIDSVIAANEAEIKKLNNKIAETEQKLEETQEALAEMLIDIHFSDDSEPIKVLAGSKTISDFAEKAAREEIAKQEIAILSEEIKSTKESLNQQRAEVEARLEENEQVKMALASKKESQRALMVAYEKNADDAAAVARYWEEQVKSMAWTPPSNTLGFGSRWWDAPADNYPFRNVCGAGFDYFAPGNWVFPYGGLICQCTDYVSYKAQSVWGVTNNWHGDAWAYIYGGGRYVPNSGATTYVDGSPSARSIAIWPATYAGDTGHVAWVESVNSDGSINVTEYNVDYAPYGCYEKSFCSRSGVGSAGLKFLHFD